MVPGLILASFFCFFVVHFFFSINKTAFHGSKQVVHKAPPQHLKELAFGFPDMIADMLWLQYLQDADYCGPQKTCEMGWAYQMLLSIHDLAPKFRIPMAVGPMNLTILSDDIKGASALYDLAVQSFPNDWPILYRAAYHYIYDVNEPSKAAEYLERAATNGAPEWLNSLAARLYQKDGKTELAIKTLEEYRKTLTKPSDIEKVDTRIKSLKLSL